MTIDLYYFSGTGNSLAIARKLGEKLDNSRLISIPRVTDGENSISGDIIGIITPIYMHRAPHIVVDFIKKIKSAKYIFVAFPGGGQLGKGLTVTKSLFDSQNLKLSAMFNFPMPDNYTPYGGTPADKQVAFLKNAEAKIIEMASIVNDLKEHFDSAYTSFFKTHIHPGILYAMGYPRINIMDGNFFIDENCNGCDICQKVCPVNNVSMENKKPVWNNKCQQCYACLQWCPKESIQSSKKTAGVKRYHHPEITVKDIINSAALTSSNPGK
ncbi:MAG: hypothetical protein GY757_31370 [bacterium]|nr:hypothetical protein [bacterium]